MKNDLLLCVNKKSVAKKVPVDAPFYPVGTWVIIKRPHLWSNCRGEVVSVTDGLHRIKIPTLPTDDGGVRSCFHTDCNGNELEVDL